MLNASKACIKSNITFELLKGQIYYWSYIIRPKTFIVYNKNKILTVNIIKVQLKKSEQATHLNNTTTNTHFASTNKKKQQ